MGIKKNSKKLKKLIRKSKNIFLMAHQNLDLDAIGSCLGMYTILKKIKKECFIIIDDETEEMGVKKILNEIEGCYNIIKSSDIPVYLHKNNKKNLLVILDTNKENLVQSPKSLEYFDRLVVIDHHELGKNSIEDGLIIIEENTSSASEMVVEIANIYNIEFSAYIATLLLAGIVLDTYNFTLKTNANTFYTAYYLTAYGASPKKVQYLLKQDIEMYKEQQKLLTNIETTNKIALAKGSQYITYRREELARVADTLLFFDNVEASFVIGKIGKTKVGVSARSLGNINISKTMEHLSGGGDALSGATVFDDKKISEVYKLVKDEIEKVGE